MLNFPINVGEILTDVVCLMNQFSLLLHPPEVNIVIRADIVTKKQNSESCGDKVLVKKENMSGNL